MSETIDDIVCFDTIEDIVSALRQMNQGLSEDSDPLVPSTVEEALKLADRIEAAHKRESRDIAMEHAVLPAVCITKKPDGNAAKLREALEAVLDAMCCGDIGAMGDCPSYSELEEVRELTEKMNAALAAPPRNCDVGTVDEQCRRHCQWCKSTRDNSCHISMCRRCYAKWAQLPYEEGENDEQK